MEAASLFPSNRILSDKGWQLGTLSMLAPLPTGYLNVQCRILAYLPRGSATLRGDAILSGGGPPCGHHLVTGLITSTWI